MKKAVILKSMRTLSGAEDWARLMRAKYPEAKVVSNDSLKSFPPLSPLSSMAPSAHHVIMESDVSPVVSVLKKSDVGEIVKAMMEKGFMEVGSFGPSLTSKWHEMIDGYVKELLKDSLKSVDENRYTFDDNGIDSLGAFVLLSLGDAMKSLEDSEYLASLTEATENDEFGHALRDNKAISDSEAKAGFERDAPDADVRDPEMDGEEVSDGDIDSATYEGDHNRGQKVLAQPGKKEARKSADDDDDYAESYDERMKKYDNEGEDPEEVVYIKRGREPQEPWGPRYENNPAVEKQKKEGRYNEITGRWTARKSVEDFDDYMYTTFKSVDEARQWQNPDIGVYQVAPVTEKEKRLFGEDAKYVVRARHGWYEASLLKSASTEADKRTQGLTSPESVSDDGGTDDVEARARKVDALKGLGVESEEALKSLIDEVFEDVLKGYDTDVDGRD